MDGQIQVPNAKDVGINLPNEKFVKTRKEGYTNDARKENQRSSVDPSKLREG